MPLWRLDNDDVWFPPASEAMHDGLLAIGGDLRPERLLLAYRSGIFPWYNSDDPVLWWSPDPRFVLYPQQLRVSDSMKAVLRKGTFEFRMNTAFEEVMRGCAEAPRAGGQGSWIGEDMIEGYCRLHQLGFAHSGEVWQDGRLAGGLYGLRIGKIFFGESMFSRVSNASKAAFIQMVRRMQEEGLKLVDCQMHTPHLESLGGEPMPRETFLSYLKEAIW